MKPVNIRGTVIGSGRPAVCIPIVGGTRRDICAQARAIAEAANSIDKCTAEWRADCFDEYLSPDRLCDAGNEIRDIIGDMPLIFTLRTKCQGGNADIPFGTYGDVLEAAVGGGFADLIDIELYKPEADIRHLIQIAKGAGLYVILSNHWFKKTPTAFKMLQTLDDMDKFDGDINKIAVMPRNMRDVTVLLNTTMRYSALGKRPLITMSMSKDGIISRLSGEAFGSCLTFGALGSTSAPGQIDAYELNVILNILHKYMDK